MMVARGVWTRDRLGIDRDPRPATDEEWELHKARKLEAKYRVTPEQIKQVYDRLLAEYEPLPFTHRCPTTLADDVDDYDDLKQTQEDAIA